MLEIRLNHNSGMTWHTNGNLFVKGYLFDKKNKLFKNGELLSYFSSVADENGFCEKLKEANGCFSVVLQSENQCFAAVDCVRTHPLFYSEYGTATIITDATESLDFLKMENMNEREIEVFRATGYATGGDTLFNGLYQIEAGQYIVYQNDTIYKRNYHSFILEPKDLSFSDAKIQLKKILSRIGKRLVELLDGRPAAVPLSGGLDSRLIVHLLKQQNYSPVLLFTYGSSNDNPELKRAKCVAEKCGFPWTFIDYSAYRKTNFIGTEDFEKYVAYASQYASKFYFSEYFAIDFLKNKQKIFSDTVFLPGHSGDSVSGSHLRPYMIHYKGIRNIAKDLQYKQFDLISTASKERRYFIGGLISQLKKYECSDYRAYENWILKERQAKYIVNSCRIWEYNGFEYLLPLWDKELVDFLMSMPFEFRLHQSLYRAVLKELFSEEGLWFDADEDKQEDSFMQECKILVKRLLPFLHRKSDPFSGDYYGFKEITKPMIDGIGNPEKIRCYNGIFTEWYLARLTESDA